MEEVFDLMEIILSFHFCYFLNCEYSSYQSFNPFGGVIYSENGIFEC